MPLQPTMKLSFLISRTPLLLLAFISSAHASCKKLVQQDWTELTYHLDNAQKQGFVMLCPFRISGEKNCPDPKSPGYKIHAFMVDIYCAYWWGGIGDGCVIDCPMEKNHFVIEEGAVVTMDGITTMGAQESSVHVKQYAYFKAIAGTFKNNGYKQDPNDPSVAVTNSKMSSGGSAITVDQYGYADMEQCVFENNHGDEGGAIKNKGEVILAGGNFQRNKGHKGGAVHNSGTLTANQALFRNNEAIESQKDNGAGYGGAVFTENDVIMGGSTFEKNSAAHEGGAFFSVGKSDLHFCLWKYNVAGDAGPAISGTGVRIKKNEGCGNKEQKAVQGSKPCDGVLDPKTKSCTPFESVCSLPESAIKTPEPSPEPSAAPSPAPSPQPSVLPTSSPTPIPTPRPALRPSKGSSLSGLNGKRR